MHGHAKVVCATTEYDWRMFSRIYFCIWFIIGLVSHGMWRWGTNKCELIKVSNTIFLGLYLFIMYVVLSFNLCSSECNLHVISLLLGRQIQVLPVLLGLISCHRSLWSFWTCSTCTGIFNYYVLTITALLSFFQWFAWFIL